MVTVEYRLACSGTAHLADGVHAGTDINAWQSGVELESSAAQRRPLTFEVGSRMALPMWKPSSLLSHLAAAAALPQLQRQAHGSWRVHDWCCLAFLLW